MKQLFVVILSVLFCILPSFSANHLCCYAVGEDEFKQLEDDNILDEMVLDELETIDFDKIDSYFDKYLSNEKSTTTKEYVYSLILGEESITLTDILDLVLHQMQQGLGTVLTLVLTLVVISIIGAFVQNLVANSNTMQLKDIISFVLVVVSLVIVSKVVAENLTKTINLISDISSFMEIVIPIMLGLVTIIGGSALTASFTTPLLLLTGVIVKVISQLVSVVVSVYFILGILSEITRFIKFDKFKKFIVSFFKWAIGIITSVYLAFISLTGLNVSGKAGLSIKATKYAIKSYIPLVGGYVSDSFELIKMGCVLIKNSLGVVGILILFLMIISLLSFLVSLNLGIKFVSAIAEPMGVGVLSNFFESVANTVKFMMATIIVVFVCCFVSITIIMLSLNGG